MITRSKMMVKLTMMTILLLLLPRMILASDYNIERQQGERIGSYYIHIADAAGNFIATARNLVDNTTLRREDILLNYPDCPAKILSISDLNISNNPESIRRFICISDLSSCNYQASISLRVEDPIVAIDIRTRFYDVFGQYMETQNDTWIQDFDQNVHEITTNNRTNLDIFKPMTIVTYIGRIRLADGSLWTYNTDKLASALSTLKLGEDDR